MKRKFDRNQPGAYQAFVLSASAYCYGYLHHMKRIAEIEQIRSTDHYTMMMLEQSKAAIAGSPAACRLYLRSCNPADQARMTELDVWAIENGLSVPIYQRNREA